MTRITRVGALLASLALAGGALTGCASKNNATANPSASASASASAATVDPGLLKPTLAQWIRYSGSLQYLRDSNSTLLAMQKTAAIKITDSKTLASYVTQMKASGTAATLIGQGLVSLKSPDAAMTANLNALGTSLVTLGQAARGLDAVKIATAGADGANTIKSVLTLMGDAVTKTKAVATYASAHSKDPITF